MTSEHELKRALEAQNEAVTIPGGNVAEIARRGQRRRRMQSGALGGGMAAVLVAAGVGYMSLRPGSETIIQAAAQVEPTASTLSSLPSDAAIGDDKTDGLEAAPTTLAPRPSAELAQTTLVALVDELSVAAAVDRENRCELEEPVDPQWVQIAEMPDGTRIANVTCRSGAYQMTDVRLFVLASDDSLQPVEVEWLTEDGLSDQTTLYGFVDLVGQEGQLSVFAKYRGPGDCGIEMSHRWEAATGRFVLELARAQFECPVEVASNYDPSVPWPQVFPPPPSVPDAEAPRTPPPSGGPMIVSEWCQGPELERRADHLSEADSVLLACLTDAILASNGATQFWIEDAIDVGDQTFVVWRATSFEGDFGLGTPWGYEELHVTELGSWTDRVVQRLDWEDPANADWMYAYRVEFVDAETLRVMVGWHQGECYWVDQMDFDGNLVDFSGNPYPRPATPEELSADPSLCEYSIDYEPEILDEVFDEPDLIAAF